MQRVHAEESRCRSITWGGMASHRGGGAFERCCHRSVRGGPVAGQQGKGVHKRVVHQYNVQGNIIIHHH